MMEIFEEEKEKLMICVSNMVENLLDKHGISSPGFTGAVTVDRSSDEL